MNGKVGFAEFPKSVRWTVLKEENPCDRGIFLVRRPTNAAFKLMKATVQAFGVKAAKQTRYIKAINYCISQYDFDTVCNALNSIEATEKLRIEAAKCEDKISCIQHLIIERVIEMRNAQQQ